ncbi:alcohol dehydrogenase catalytic domain-containing protein [Vibrio sp. C8]
MAEINYAWTFNAETKEPEDLELRELELPKLSGEDVLIKNLTIALNPVDWKVIHPGMVRQDGYQVAGVDGCGVVVAKGPNANVNIGDHVAYHQTWILCSLLCDRRQCRIQSQPRVGLNYRCSIDVHWAYCLASY